MKQCCWCSKEVEQPKQVLGEGNRFFDYHPECFQRYQAFLERNRPKLEEWAKGVRP